MMIERVSIFDLSIRELRALFRSQSSIPTTGEQHGRIFGMRGPAARPRFVCHWHQDFMSLLIEWHTRINRTGIFCDPPGSWMCVGVWFDSRTIPLKVDVTFQRGHFAPINVLDADGKVLVKDIKMYGLVEFRDRGLWVEACQTRKPQPQDVLDEPRAIKGGQ